MAITKDPLSSKAMAITKDHRSTTILPSKATGTLNSSSTMHHSNTSKEAVTAKEGTHHLHRKERSSSAMARHRATHSSTVPVPDGARRC